MHSILWWLLILPAFLWLDRLLKRKFPRLWVAAELLANLILTGLSLLFICLQLSALQKTVSSQVSTTDKVVLSGFILGAVAVFLFLLVMTWRRWWKNRKRVNHDPSSP